MHKLLPNCVWVLVGLLLPALSLAELSQAETNSAEHPLRNNPFSRPVEVVAPTVVSKAAATEQREITLTLNGTLVAGKDGKQSFADIGGKVFAVGEEINGQRLVEVHPRYVVLAAETRNVVLWVNGSQADE